MCISGVHSQHHGVHLCLYNIVVFKKNIFSKVLESDDNFVYIELQLTLYDQYSQHCSCNSSSRMRVINHN